MLLPHKLEREIGVAPENRTLLNGFAIRHLPSWFALHIGVEAGIEPWSLDSQSSILPLNYNHHMAPQAGYDPAYYGRSPLRRINSAFSYQLEYRGINVEHRGGIEPQPEGVTLKG